MIEYEKLIVPELIKFVTGFALLLITWGVGQRIIAYWDTKKKQLEFDIATAAQFQNIYGEAKEVNRLWRNCAKYRKNGVSPFNQSKEVLEKTSWDILQRAVSVESKMEAITVKLATERDLTQDEIESLGLLRQAFQQLREDMRDDKESTFIGYGAGYNLFNALACNVAYIIASGRHKDKVTAAKAQSNLKAIAKIGSGNLFEEAKKLEYQVWKHLDKKSETSS